MDIPGKEALKTELCAILRGEVDAALRAQKATREAATHEEAKPENDKDTRALEQSYLARGQALRARELETALAEMEAMPLRVFREEDPIALGALVFAIENDAPLVVLIALHGGGHKLTGGVQVVTPQSPIGRALLGKHAGDDCDFAAAGKTRSLEIERVV